MKKTLGLALGRGVELTYIEMETLLERITYTINSRPLAIANTPSTSQQEDVLMPITPNQLLLGRSTIDVPDMKKADDKFSDRQAYMKAVHETWLKKWNDEVLPTLVPCIRWKHIQKNVKKGNMLNYEIQVF